MADGAVDRTPFHVALRLYAIAALRWPEVDGTAALAGVDPFALRPERFCNLIYAWAVDRVEDRERFDAALEEPIPGGRGLSAASAADDGDAFLSFMTEHRALAGG